MKDKKKVAASTSAPKNAKMMGKLLEWLAMLVVSVPSSPVNSHYYYGYFNFFIIIYFCSHRKHVSPSAALKMDEASTSTTFARELKEGFAAGGCFAFQRIKLGREGAANGEDSAPPEDVRPASLLEFTDISGVETEEDPLADSNDMVKTKKRKQRVIDDDDDEDERDSEGEAPPKKLPRGPSAARRGRDVKDDGEDDAHDDGDDDDDDDDFMLEVDDLDVMEEEEEEGGEDLEDGK